MFVGGLGFALFKWLVMHAGSYTDMNYSWKTQLIKQSLQVGLKFIIRKSLFCNQRN